MVGLPEVRAPHHPGAFGRPLHEEGEPFLRGGEFASRRFHSAYPRLHRANVRPPADPGEDRRLQIGVDAVGSAGGVGPEEPHRFRTRPRLTEEAVVEQDLRRVGPGDRPPLETDLARRPPREDRRRGDRADAREESPAAPGLEERVERRGESEDEGQASGKQVPRLHAALGLAEHQRHEVETDEREREAAEEQDPAPAPGRGRKIAAAGAPLPGREMERRQRDQRPEGEQGDRTGVESGPRQDRAADVAPTLGGAVIRSGRDSGQRTADEEIPGEPDDRRQSGDRRVDRRGPKPRPPEEEHSGEGRQDHAHVPGAERQAGERR